eukprot:XP_001693411.1 predicted protein [Chlamydomonas reinhardtii]
MQHGGLHRPGMRSSRSSGTGAYPHLPKRHEVCRLEPHQPCPTVTNLFIICDPYRKNAALRR